MLAVPDLRRAKTGCASKGFRLNNTVSTDWIVPSPPLMTTNATPFLAKSARAEATSPGVCASHWDTCGCSRSTFAIGAIPFRFLPLSGLLITPTRSGHPLK